MAHYSAVFGEAYTIVTMFAIYGLYQGAVATFYGIDVETGEELGYLGRAFAGVFLIADVAGVGWVNRVFPKNIPFSRIIGFTPRLHLEHKVDAPATSRAMAAALMFSEEIADEGITVAGKNGVGAEIVAKLTDGTLIGREVSVFQGHIRNAYGTIIAEADQIGRGMTEAQKGLLAKRDVFMHVTDDLASNPESRLRLWQAAKNAEELYRTDYNQVLRVTIVDSKGYQIAP